jgi:DNA repair exonuclease SbcCD ATPase subunit
MNDKETNDLLQQLHDKIDNIQAVDKKGRDLLEDLDGDIRKLLERTDEQPYNIHPNLAQRLENAIQHFEASHPDLTELLSKVMNDLSNAGV